MECCHLQAADTSVRHGAPHISPRATPHDHAEGPRPIILQALSLVEKAEPVQPHCAWGTNGWSMWMQDACKVYLDSYVTSNGSRLMLTWVVFKNRLLEACRTQNWEIMALRTLTTVDLLWFYYVWGPVWLETHRNSIWLRVWSHMASH